jgi:hypothetical protein
VSKLLKLARLPSVVVSAFESPMDISETWGLDLAEAWEDPARRATMSSAARRLAQEQARLPPRHVYSQLIGTSAATRRAIRTKRDQIVRSSQGRPLYKVKRLNKTIVLTLPRATLSEPEVDSLLLDIAEILQAGRQSGAIATRDHVYGQGPIANTVRVAAV